MPKKTRSKFTWNYNKRTFSRWLRGRLNPTMNSIDPFCMIEAIKETELSHKVIYNIINYWRRTSKYYWDVIHQDEDNVIKDWETFVHNLNSTYEVYFLVAAYQKEVGDWVWFQPDFDEKEERDNKVLNNHIKGIFTRLDEMALMGEEVSATRLPAAQVVDALKSYDRRFLRDGTMSPAHGTLLSERCRVYNCPICKTGKMRQMRNRDWQCRECRVTYTEDEFNEMIKKAVPE